MIGSFILSHDFKVMRFRPGVDYQCLHEPGMSIECVKLTKLLQKHPPLFRVQVDSLCCMLSIQIKERTVKSLTFSVNLHTF